MSPNDRDNDCQPEIAIWPPLLHNNPLVKIFTNIIFTLLFSQPSQIPGTLEGEGLDGFCKKSSVHAQQLPRISDRPADRQTDRRKRDLSSGAYNVTLANDDDVGPAKLIGLRDGERQM